MALPMLAGGADCGPSNPLQSLTKRLDQDRGLQKDRFISGQAGPSQESFRHAGPSRARDQDAARFFGGSSRNSPVSLQSPHTFDMSLVHASLPMAQQHMQNQQPHVPQAQQQSPALAAWASDFMQQQPMNEKVANEKLALYNSHAQKELQQHQHQHPQLQTQQVHGMSGMIQGPMNWNQFPITHNQPSAYNTGMQMQAPPVVAPKLDDRLWHQEFDRQQASTPTPVHTETQQTSLSRPSAQDSDDLARTAGLLVESVSAESNPKFANSQFMGLMRNLRDREIVVEGDKLVEGTAEQKAAAAVDVKGKGRMNHHQSTGVDLEHRRAHRSVERSFERRLARGGIERDAMMVDRPDQLAEEGPELDEDPNEAYFKQENAEFQTYWDAHHAEPAPMVQASAQQDEWSHLQESWDYFEATSSGITEIDNYQFQDNNPYLLGERSRTRHHMAHLNGPQTFYESVLELEAAVQRDPSDASAWYELGVKQQENEREQKAIKALRRAVELDPTHLPTYIALAVSYTNDNNRPGTYQVIREWVQRNETYVNAVKEYEAANPEVEGVGYADKFNSLIQCLISMARSDTSGAVDADIQIAIAVLLNTNEDYARAQDCFRAALSVRPDDWLLYNRVGATMANSGKPQEAIEYYYRALQLNPAYIRARFNLGISCINLRRYDEAAQNILDALVLQDSDGIRDNTGMNDKRGVTSSALWDSLKTTAHHMRRPDLASLCDFHDLEGFRAAFP